MATQSLYRRYRPRRFADLRGQDHVVTALREAARAGREGQAYLFSGPRGTGKTSTARILAKVLNCVAPDGGEPCCECESCLAIERGTSYDVHELDAASHNGVDSIRDLIEKAALGTPGRHRVYILDEVHMLTRAAEAALLKTLEEPPDHVVFVLATTDPQKVSDTVRSRTQHLQFHLLGPAELDEHIRWVAADAGIDLDDDAFRAVLQRANGSVRDGLSALELMAATGGDTSGLLDVEPLIAALSERDTGAALTALAGSLTDGHDPRAVAEALVRRLRDGFLALMAPDLVQLPMAQIPGLTESAHELGPTSMVRAIERLGTAMIEMRSAPDPRVVLEVALVRLTHPEVGTDLEALADRVAKLEDQIRARPATTPAAEAPPTTPAGRAALGGRARRAASPTPSTSDTTPSTGMTRPTVDPTPVDAGAPLAESSPPPAPPPSAPSTTAPTPEPPATPPTEPATAPPTPGPTADSAASMASGGVAEIWAEILRQRLRPFVRAMYAAGSISHRDGSDWYFNAPNQVHADRCEAHRAEVESALGSAVGAPVRLVITTAGHDHTDSTGLARPTDTPSATTSAEVDERPDPAELTDAPPGSVLSPIDRLAQAFPGAELIDETAD